jgi:16S rRNA (guanine1207-N2)-methyltransferase
MPARNAEGFLTAPGMFSPERADPGSRRLAATLEGRLKGRVADLGAGWGWLAQAALSGSPAISEIDLYEAEALALDAARANVADPRARFHWSDVTRLGARVPPYDAVIANPPFHQGRAAEASLGAGFIAAAARILKPSGQFLMVANRQLPYEAVVAAAFRRSEKLAEDGSYKVILAERPRGN